MLEQDVAALLRKQPYPKLSLKAWRIVCAFHRAAFRKTGCEAATVLFHRKDPDGGKTRWTIFIPWQTVTPAHVSYSWDNPRNKEFIDDMASKGCDTFDQCTIHSHASMPAFESGTDASDEINLTGWHITLGRLGSPVLDLHARATLMLPKDYRNAATNKRMISVNFKPEDCVDATHHELANPSDATFPDGWLSRLTEPRPHFAFPVLRRAPAVQSVFDEAGWWRDHFNCRY